MESHLKRKEKNKSRVKCKIRNIKQRKQTRIRKPRDGDSLERRRNQTLKNDEIEEEIKPWRRNQTVWELRRDWEVDRGEEDREKRRNREESAKLGFFILFFIFI